ncbi:DUF1524 domain-containing protein [Streptomyces sp. NPDC012769]|uniref:GmrSD restriction endonuclease domain-containing protein n=1 Tax=Streptomyces sp. NPDC012769 TaxID=3364848 RepID=UPI0036AAAD07
MIKNLLRGLTPLALILSPLAAPGPAPAAHAASVVLLPDALAELTEDTEVPAGFKASAFRHWNAGLDPADGCDTRGEVLLAEAVDAPALGPKCTMTGGRWTSPYDGQTVTDPAALRVDHLVPLAEAWGSGASDWTAARREKFANDQGAAGTLVAVTARSQKDRSGREPADWLPSAEAHHCRYLGDWVGTKLRWGLTADKDEMETLKLFADGPCEQTVVYRAAAPR